MRDSLVLSRASRPNIFRRPAGERDEPAEGEDEAVLSRVSRVEDLERADNMLGGWLKTDAT